MKWLAAIVAVLALGAAAKEREPPTGLISGQLSYPGHVVPALTIVARSLEPPRTILLDTRAGQEHYRLRVPAGRYIVFAVPREARDPLLRGAYTGYSLCNRIIRQGGRPIRACTTGAPLTVVVEPNTHRRHVDIDDWYLTDEVAATLQLPPPAAHEAGR